MTAYWITFTDGSQACCEGVSEYDAKRIAEHFTKKTVIGNKYGPAGAAQLPYPAEPIIWQFDHPTSGKTPTFCCTPNQCAGKSSCPKSRACDD